MIKNYFKIALRNIIRHKVYSFINILGLAIGMSCTILILLWVQDELSYDRFHSQLNNIHKIYLKVFYENSSITSDNTFSAVAIDLKNNYPEVINSARFITLEEFILKVPDRENQNTDKIFLEKRGAAADPSFLEMFSFPLLKGNQKDILKNPNSILLTEETAKRYFNNHNVIGKTITINSKHNVIVTGILENIPVNSDIQFDYLLPLDFMKKSGWNLNDYNSNNCKTFLLPHESASAQALIQKIQTEYDKSIPVQNFKFQHLLEPLQRIHLYGAAYPPRIVFIFVFIALAIAILLIASINFINLSTARSMNRAKEIGVRKVVGARRIQLVKQFLFESIFIAFFALCIAILIIKFILPFFNQVTVKQINFNFFNPQNVLYLLGIIGVTGILAGVYPALFLSRFSPLQVLKGSLAIRKRKLGKISRARLRKVLVVTQFILTIILLVNILNGFRWDKHMNQLGFDKDNVICLQSRGDLGKNYTAFKNELLKNPNIELVANSSHLPLCISNNITQWGLAKEQKGIIAGYAKTGYDYSDIFKLKILEGRFFSKNFPSDENNSIIINEKAVSTQGLKNPIGQRLYIHNQQYTIVGVIQDFHFMPKLFEIQPLILRLRPDNSFIFIRIKTDKNNLPVENIAHTLEYINRVHKKINPEYPAETFFLNEYIFDEAKMIMAAEKVIIAFTAFGIFIAALGLFGLSSFMIEQRTKEIGIRKVLGASVKNVLVLLTKDYLKLIVIANIIAWPISYFIEQAQTNFIAYTIDFSFWLFLIAGCFVLFIALMAVGAQSYLASKRNPVTSLKYE